MTQYLGIATDLYQLTMAAGYHAHQRNETATFELFVRKLPPHRSFLMVAGIAQALEYLQALRFSNEEISYLKSLPMFAHVSEEFFVYLREFKFTGDVWATPEGTIAFPNEPILRITAPLIEAQILETYLLATINFQTLIATKAARIVSAANGCGIVEFGTRRAHGMDAGLHAARASFIGGCVGTSNVEAGLRFGLPVFGTAAHSWVMSFENEFDSFTAFHKIFPEHTTLLLDTYDTLAAAKMATKIGSSLRGVRLDSGDLLTMSKQVREILDAGGLQQTKIMASGDLDEEKIADLLAQDAPIDLFGVGTDLSTSRDAPALAGVYKLVELNGKPKMKLSQDKATYPYCKQVWRVSDKDEIFQHDIIGLATESHPDAKPLLQQVMQSGKLLDAQATLQNMQTLAHEQLQKLPAKYKLLTDAATYPVNFSTQLESARQRELKLHSSTAKSVAPA